MHFVWLLQISTQILVFYHSFLSLLEEYVYCSFKALSQLQVKGSQGHLALRRFVDVKAPPNLDDPPRVEDHLPVVQGVAVLDHQGDFPPGKAAFQFRELSMLFFTLLRAFARQQSDGGQGGAIPKNATQIKRKKVGTPVPKENNWYSLKIQPVQKENNQCAKSAMLSYLTQSSQRRRKLTTLKGQICRIIHFDFDSTW